jgi:hypothetical protein
MLLERLDGGGDAGAVSSEHRLPSGPGAVALGHESCAGADIANRHPTRAEVSDKRDPLCMTGAVAAMAARCVALYEWDEARLFIVAERVRRYAGRVGQLTDGHDWKLSAKRQRFDLDEKLRSKERRDLDQGAGWRVSGIEELIASSTEVCEV